MKKRSRFRHNPDDFIPPSDRGILPDVVGGGADKTEESVVDKEQPGERPFANPDSGVTSRYLEMLEELRAGMPQEQQDRERANMMLSPLDQDYEGGPGHQER